LFCEVVCVYLIQLTHRYYLDHGLATFCHQLQIDETAILGLTSLMRHSSLGCQSAS
jgi:hypothetical protein